MHRYLKYQNKIIEFLALSLVVIIAFSIYMIKQFKTPLLYGIDGPYYYVQVLSLIKRGSLKYVDPPLAFYILYVFSVTLNDITLGIKVGSVLVTLLATYAIHYFVRDVSGSIIGGILTALLFVFHPFLARLCFELIKNAMGLTFLAMTILFSYRSCKKADNKIYPILTSTSILLTGLTHVLDFAVAYGIVMLLFMINLRNKNVQRKLLLPFIVGSALLLLGFIYEPIMGGDPYKGISYLSSLIHGGTAKVPSGNRPITMIHQREVITHLIYMTSLPLIIGLAGMFFSITALNNIERNFIFALSFALTMLSLPIGTPQFIMRFNLMSAILIPPILGSMIGTIKDRNLKIVMGAIILAFIIPQFASQMNNIRPSIPLEEYYEIAYLVSKTPKHVTFIVPDVRLRYWIETFDVNVVCSPMDGGVPPYILIFEKNPFRRVPIPPGSELVFNGKYIQAYVLRVRFIRGK
ncbi:MAG: hypothetical protein DRZ82_06600 [Thermoprotei archaeon]|nr:MAG: hypothetical protein DRZ82_06600 [Thermoprotei archaeon]